VRITTRIGGPFAARGRLHFGGRFGPFALGAETAAAGRGTVDPVMRRTHGMTSDLAGVAQTLVTGGRGILALDESVKSCNERFARLGIAQTPEARRAYRELLIGAAGIERYVSGAILDDEAIRQSTALGWRFADVLRERAIVPGVRVDTGTSPLAFAPGETVTEGLDGLRGRLAEYAVLGAGFATWRAVFRIGEIVHETPSDRAIAANAHALARFAAICQESGIVPVVESDVLADGDHDIALCASVTERVLRRIFAELEGAGVALDAIVLKTNMVTPGIASAQQAATADIVGATLRVLGATVPVAVAGVAFLSGSAEDRLAAERLCAMNKTMPRRRPWPLTFAYDRALQQAALETWRGRDDRVEEAQRVFVHRAYCNGLAACGAYTAKLEDLVHTFVPRLAA
jgi:fructose-bisphosphate aldolase, class I